MAIFVSVPRTSHLSGRFIMSLIFSRVFMMYGIAALISFSVAALMKGMFAVVRLTRKDS
jgi:hypothetical protein